MNNQSSKTQNSSRNLIFGVCLKVYQLIVPFVIRTVIIKVLGMEYAGLNSLFVSILQVLNITELGVGSALVYSMYKPIQENDTVKICALMRLYKLYYRAIGSVVLIMGLALTPFLPKLIKGTVPLDINLYTLYYLNLCATVLSYWLFAYKNSLFQAHQRNDIISKVTIFTNTVMYILQISLLILLKNYYVYVIIILFAQVLNNVIIALCADKFFPQYKAVGSLERGEIKRINGTIKDLFYGQLGLIITNSVGSIVISAFLGLIPLAIYQNYYYILNALIGFYTIFYQSCRASIGTNLISKSMEANYEDYKFITLVIVGTLAFCVSCLLCMYQPFIELWVGKENLLDEGCVLLLGLYLFVYELSWVIGTYKDVSGKWHADRFRPLVTAGVNLVMNIVLIQYLGLHGILLATILSFLLVNIPWLYHRVFVDVFDQRYKVGYGIYLIKKIGILLFVVLINVNICSFLTFQNLFLTLGTRLVSCAILTCVMYYLFNARDVGMERFLNIVKKLIKLV